MAGEKITGLLNQATFLGSEDLMLVSKKTGITTYESQKVAPSDVVYDSGWKTINIHNGAFGMADTGNPNLRPKLRVFGRTVYIEGQWTLPMDNGSGALNTNGVAYPNAYRNTLWGGALTGLSVGPTGLINTLSPIVPTALYPEAGQRIGNAPFSKRPYNPSVGVRSILVTQIPQLAILPDGKIQMSTVESVERNGISGVGAYQQTMLTREWVSKFVLGDRIMNYTNWWNSFLMGNDRRAYTNGGSTYDFSCDATLGGQLGGFEIFFTGSWQISKLTTLEQIKAAFDSI